MFGKIIGNLKTRILGDHRLFSQKEYDFQKQEGFPDWNEGVGVADPEEFRRILNEQKPKVIYTRIGGLDDLTKRCEFYIRLKVGSMVRMSSYMPRLDSQGNVIPGESHYSVISDFPYKYYGYENIVDRPKGIEEGVCKFILRDGSDSQ